MSHYPVNHHLRPVYRVLAGLAAVYLLAFGAVGLVRAQGAPFFDQGDAIALGLPTNPAFSVLAAALGAVVLVGVLIGRNADTVVNRAAGWLMLVVGMAMLTLLRTDGNVLNFSVATCVVWFVVGMLLITAALYGRTGSAEAARAEEAYRHGRA